MAQILLHLQGGGILKRAHSNSSNFVYFIVLINVVIYGYCVKIGGGKFDISPETLGRLGGDVPHLTTNGQWWRIFSSSFLHGNLVHLISNMAGILYITPYLGRFFSKSSVGLIYLASIVFGSFASLFFYVGYPVSVGASDGVFGLYGAFLTYVVVMGRFKDVNTRILVNAAQVVFFNLGFGSEGINAWAHLGGLFGGVLFSYALISLSRVTTAPEKFKLLTASLALIFGVGLVALPKIDQDMTRAVIVEMNTLIEKIKVTGAMINKLQAGDESVIPELLTEIRTGLLPTIKQVETNLKNLEIKNDEDEYYRTQALSICHYSRKNMAYFYSAVKSLKGDKKKFNQYVTYAQKYDDLLAQSMNNFKASVAQKYGQPTPKRQVANSESL